jgi:hypothetical protein
MIEQKEEAANIIKHEVKGQDERLKQRIAER